LELLREIIIPKVLEKIRKVFNGYPEEKDIPESIKCSKHWWYDYLETNPGLQEL